MGIGSFFYQNFYKPSKDVVAAITPWETEYEQSQDYHSPENQALRESQALAEDVVVAEEVDEDGDGRTDYTIDPSTGEIIKDYRELWGQLDEAQEMGIPDLDSWMTEQDYEFFDPMARDTEGQFTDQTMQNMQGLIDQLTTGPSAMELSEAQAYAAQLMGMDPADYQATVGGLLAKSTADVNTLQGLSPEERAIRERINRGELRGMEERAGRMINNIQASTGSVSRSYAAADQAIRQINDVQLQQQMTMYQDDYAQKIQQQEQAQTQWAAMVQSGQMSSAQYLNLLQQSKSMAFQGYATQVTTMMQNNQQYLQEYQADAMAIEANINNIYKAIQMEMGIDDKIINDIQTAYDMEMRPILDQMNIAIDQINRREADEDAQWSAIFDVLSLAATIGLSVATLGVAPEVGVAAAQGSGIVRNEMV